MPNETFPGNPGPNDNPTIDFSQVDQPLHNLETNPRIEFLQQTFSTELIKDLPHGGVDEAAQARRIAVIRTSDRIMYKRCRRRWGWQSHLRHNLGPIQKASPLWLGSGVHFALEDYHGHRRFPTIQDSFLAYVEATRKQGEQYMPLEWREDAELGIKMLDYYLIWLEARDPLTTFVYNGLPQVEVNFQIPIPIDEEYLHRCGYDMVIYAGTIDRVIIDENGFLWLVEYKTAKQIQTLHFQVDPQVGAYLWAGEHLYPGYPIGGIIYQQHRKDVPNGGRILLNGDVSLAKNQKTTHRAYRQTLLEVYKDPKNFPKAHLQFLSQLAIEEDADHDAFIRRDKVYRNNRSGEAEAQKIMLEVMEMINPHLPLYPNPTRDCAYMCPFLSSCVSLDDGSDWEQNLQLEFEPRTLDIDDWKKYLPSVEAKFYENLRASQQPLLFQVPGDTFHASE